MSKPFVSFIVMAYNAESFIKEAIEGALAQTYDNMEIIISDDCSTDNTFQIITETIAEYHGSKIVRVLQNKKNLGIGAHLNKLWWEEAKGEWIVPSAGDDISLPQRTEIMMNEVKEGIALIHGNHISINKNSQIIKRESNYEKKMQVFFTGDVKKVVESGICVIGCCMAINKKMLDFYGPLQPNVISEDIVLAYRSIGYGRIIYIRQPLVQYRIHSESISYTSANEVSFDNWKEQKLDFHKKSKWEIALINQIEIDLHKLSISDFNFLKEKKQRAEIDWFHYGNGKFRIKYIQSKYFFREQIKKQIYPIKYFINNALSKIL